MSDKLFIRTQEGHIYEYVEQRIHKTQHEKFGLYRHNINIEYEPIINQADTIEELCDRFVFCDIYWGKEVHRCEDRFKALLDRYDIIIDETLPCFVENQYYKEDDNFVEIEKGMWLDKDKVEKGVYGAVWTNKGLIYVAKMNDRGELELI